jgi:hypothetical protein
VEIKEKNGGESDQGYKRNNISSSSLNE